MDPGAVFDELVARGQQLFDSEADRAAQLALATADDYTTGQAVAASTATNAEAEAVNEVLRERLVAAGLVDDQRLGRVADRRRRPRDDTQERHRHGRGEPTWIVRAVTDSGEPTAPQLWTASQRVARRVRRRSSRVLPAPTVSHLVSQDPRCRWTIQPST